MNINKFTEFIAAVQGCEKIAYEYGNQEVEQEHLLYALIIQNDSLIMKLIEKMGIRSSCLSIVWKKVFASARRCRADRSLSGQDLNKALIHAEDEAKQMGDEYVSVEHIFLSLLKYPNREIKQIFREFGITRDRFLQVLSTVRGNQR